MSHEEESALLTQDSVKMEPDPNLVSVEVLVVIAFTWRGMIRAIHGTAEDARDVEIHQSSECETK